MGRHRSAYDHEWQPATENAETERLMTKDPRLVANARDLRGNMTPAERVLWEALRKRQADGLRFRRQHLVDPYIADFACPAARLLIELDGWMHDLPGRPAYDEARTRRLEALGYRVLRFRNEAIVFDRDGVVEQIIAAARERIAGK